MLEGISPEAIEAALAHASTEEKRKLNAILSELDKRENRKKCQEDFISFVKSQYPDFISGAHHQRIAKLFEDIAAGKKKRVIINLAPRHSKSLFASYLFPAWFLGRFPKKQILQVSNTGELAEGFGRQVRNLLESESYQDIFPDVSLRSDSKSAGRWATNHNGIYYACGVGAALAGRGADLAIVDDPHTEAEALAAILNPGIYDKIYEWYTTGIRQRLQPGGAIVIVMTRWSLRDLTAQVLETAAKNDKADQWEVFEFPAILPSGKPLWPQYWSKDELETVKASIPVAKWQAQYMQDPTSDENAIIKRQDWRIWEAERPPPVEYIIMAMDTAFEARKSADYSAAVFFGVWNNDDDGGQPNLILLNAWRDKLEFPELKAKTLEMYKEWEPDSIIIEKRASGAPLIYELRRMGIPVGEFTPSRGNDKITRLNAIADIFASGKVWRPDTRWAEEVVDEMAAFPNARNDDLTDCVSLALARYRQGGFIGTQHDEEDVDFSLYRARKAQYY